MLYAKVSLEVKHVVTISGVLKFCSEFVAEEKTSLTFEIRI